MANHIPDAELSNFNGKSVAQSMEDSIPLETNSAREQDNNTDFTQLKESPKAEGLHCLQDTDKWTTKEDQKAILETLRKMNKMVTHTHNIVARLRKHTITQQLLNLDLLQNLSEISGKHPLHAERHLGANTAPICQKRRKELLQQFFKIQQTLTPNHSSHQPNDTISSSPSNIRYHNMQTQRLAKNHCSSPQTPPIFLQQYNDGSPEPQTYEPNSSQSNTSNKRTKTRQDCRRNNSISG